MQIIGVILLLVVSTVIRKMATDYSSRMYDFFLIFYVNGIFVIFLYQMCYWLIEKYDDLIRLIKKFHYFIGFVIIMLSVNYAITYFMFMVVLMWIRTPYLDVTIIMLTSFIISTLLGNYLIKRLLKK